LLLSSDQIDDTGPVKGQVTLNKRELASALKVSLPTIGAWMQRWPDFPIEARGTNGSSYRFVYVDVAEFLTVKRDEEAQAKSERDEALMGLQLTFDALLPPQPSVQFDRRLSPKEEIDLWKLRDLKRREAERCGKLVIASEVQELFTNALARLSRDTSMFLRKLAREQNWPDSQVRNIEERFADVQRASVAEALSELNMDADPNERQLDLS